MEHLVDNILEERGRLRLEAKDLERSGGNSPAFKLSYVMVRANGVRDWFTGVRLDSLGTSSVWRRALRIPGMRHALTMFWCSNRAATRVNACAFRRTHATVR